MENGVWYLVAVLSLAAAVLLVRWLVLRHALRLPPTGVNLA